MVSAVDPGLIDDVVERRIVEGHDGRSGAGIERVLFRDGRRLIVKTVVPSEDLTCVIDPDAADRELRLFESGVLDGLPSPLAPQCRGDGVRRVAWSS
jgi:hypothetical protein